MQRPSRTMIPEPGADTVPQERTHALPIELEAEREIEIVFLR